MQPGCIRWDSPTASAKRLDTSALIGQPLQKLFVQKERRNAHLPSRALQTSPSRVSPLTRRHIPSPRHPDDAQRSHKESPFHSPSYFKRISTIPQRVAQQRKSASRERSGHVLHGGNHFEHRVSHSSAEVVRLKENRVRSVLMSSYLAADVGGEELLERCGVADSEITDVEIVAHTGAIFRVVVTAKHTHLCALSDRHLSHNCAEANE